MKNRISFRPAMMLAVFALTLMPLQDLNAVNRVRPVSRTYTLRHNGRGQMEVLGGEKPLFLHKGESVMIEIFPDGEPIKYLATQHFIYINPYNNFYKRFKTFSPNIFVSLGRGINLDLGLAVNTRQGRQVIWFASMRNFQYEASVSRNGELILKAMIDSNYCPPPNHPDGYTYRWGKKLESQYARASNWFKVRVTVY